MLTRDKNVYHRSLNLLLISTTTVNDPLLVITFKVKFLALLHKTLMRLSYVY